MSSLDPRRLLSLPTLLLVAGLALGPPPATAQDAPADIASAVEHLEFREIGPTIMGGRIADIAVVESDPSTFYVGTATGGVWKTVNGGTTFEVVFSDRETASIGDVTVAPSNPNVVWVGSGEPQNRQSSPWGNGVYRSLDAGRSWTHVGLENTHHIGRIQVHPTDPDVAYVAAVGHLWGPNPERGVYRTSDGGETWEKVLYVDENTGAIDLAMDPSDPNTLFAAMYQRRRTAWGFNGGGPGSGVYRTLDGGETWEELTNGLPSGDKGRIGLDIYRGDSNLVMAIVEADPESPDEDFGDDDRGPQQNGVYESTDRGESWEQVSTTNNRPMYYSQIRIDPNDPERIYLGGSSLYRSSDGGDEFTSDAAEGVHPDHHALWIDPSDSDHLILGSDGGVSISWDRGESWRQLRNLPVSQFYEISVDDQDPYHVCGGLQDNGSWCAPSDTRSTQGIRPRHWYNIGSGDGFFTVPHPDGRYVFAESQGGNLVRTNLETRERKRIRPVDRTEGEEDDEDELRFNWDTPVVLSGHDASTIYIGSNHLFRSRDLGMSWERISPDLTYAIEREELEIMGVKGSEPQMSLNDGAYDWGNLTAIAESPLNPDVLYAGSDDGRIQVTRDGGTTWTDLTPNVPDLPEHTYVTRIVASHADEGTVWAAFDGHRNDDFAPYLYLSENYGEDWELRMDGLPESSLSALAQHPTDPDLLFTGNERGVWFSVNGGEEWTSLAANLPTVPVDDIEVQERENDLVLGTHGRGIWILPDVTPLEQLSTGLLASAAHLFPVRDATLFNPYSPQGWSPGIWQAENPPEGALIRYYLASDLEREEAVAEEEAGADGDGETQEGGQGEGPETKLTVLDADGEVVRELEGPGKAGIRTVSWDLRIEPPYEPEEPRGGFFGSPRGPKVLPGSYTVRLEAAGETMEAPLDVRLASNIELGDADLVARQEALMDAYRLAEPVYRANRAVDRVEKQLAEVESLLEEQDSPPEELQAAADSLKERVEELDDDLGEAQSSAFVTFAIEGSYSRPTEDQLWQIDRAWEEVPPVVERINELVTEAMPALYDRLDEEGIRPDPGEAIEVPVRGGGGGM